MRGELPVWIRSGVELRLHCWRDREVRRSSEKINRRMLADISLFVIITIIVLFSLVIGDSYLSAAGFWLRLSTKPLHCTFDVVL